MSVGDLPQLNATLNGLATILLLLGWFFIRTKRVKWHIAAMITALVVSTLFLSSYLTYHYLAGSTKFTTPGLPRIVYFSILIPHVILAFVNLPMVILTVIPALRRRFDKHRRIARWTLPVWLYVSVTGVLVYLMLYRWYPPAQT